MKLTAVVLTVLAVLLLLRVMGNEAAKGSPPVACQLLGGQWTLWSGWRCG